MMTGMMCNFSCTPKVKAALLAEPGVTDAVVDLEAKTATVTGTVSGERLCAVVAGLGFGASLEPPAPPVVVVHVQGEWAQRDQEGLGALGHTVRASDRRGAAVSRGQRNVVKRSESERQAE